MKHFLFLLSAVFSTFLAYSENFPLEKSLLPKARFEENKGQWHPNVQFRVELINGAIFYEKDGYTLAFNNASEVYESQHHDGENASNVVKNDVVKAKYVGANSNVSFEKFGKSEYYRNYFIGKDESKWASDVRLYTNMVMPNLYPGIDLRYSSNEKNIKYDVVIHPNADPKQYKVAYEGQKSLNIDKQGNLTIANTLGELKELTPYAYQIINGNKVEVKTVFVIKNNEVSFEFPNGYDVNVELIIDPYLVASTYSGSTADNWGNTACPGPNGQMRVAGICFGTGYPLTAGAFQTTFNGGTQDCSISFFSSNGTTLQASTYIGGSGSDNPHSIFSTANGDLYMVGRTESTDFPFVSGCFDGTLGGGSDIFAVRLNSSLTTLLASTYVGGSGIDGANVNTSVNNGTTSYRFRFSYADTHRSQMTIDNAGNVVIASNTQSSDFPVTAGCYDNTLGGFQDGVIIKLDNFLRTNLGATYMGGSTPTGTFTVDYDACQSLQIDASNNIYVAGATNSSNFPTTAGVIHPTALGGVDGFVLKINPTLSTLLASSYLGTVNKDAAFNLDLDKNNNVHVYGLSKGGAYPTTVGTYSNANSCQFIHGLNNTLTSTIYSTKFGNGTVPNISPTAFKVDSCFNIYAVGWGRNLEQTPSEIGTTNGMPITAGAYQTTTDGADFYFITLGQNAGSLIYGSFFGQNGGTADHVDGGTSLFSDGVGEPGVVYQAVCASCGGDPSGFPTTPGAYSSTNNSGNCNNAVFKFDLETYSPKPAASFGVVNTCTSSVVTFTNSSLTASTYTWNFGDGTPTSTLTSPAHSYTANGTYTVLLTAFNPTTCITTASKSLTLAINFSTLTINVLSGINPSCASQTVILQATGANTYTWMPSGVASPTILVSPSITTNYTIVGTNTVSGCNKTAVFTLSVNPNPTVTAVANPTSICQGGTSTLTASGASNYTWMPGNLSGTSIAASPTITTNYTVTGLSSLGCYATNTISLVVKSSPTITASASPTAICSGNSSTLTATGASTYTWNPGNLTGTVVVVSPTITTTYSLTGTNVSGCSSNQIVLLTLNPTPTISAIANPTSICVGGTSTLSASGASTYTWNPGNLTGATVTVSPVSATIYTVLGINASGCASSQTVSIGINSNPTISVIANPTSICIGGTSTLSASGASTYTWNPGNLTGTTVTVSPATATTYTVLGINISGCASSQTVSIGINANPVILASASPTAICAGSIGTLTASGASTYTWNPGNLSGTTVTVSPAGTTNYSITGTNGAGCIGTQTVDLIVNPKPTLTAVANPTAICSGNSSTLSASGANFYTWASPSGSAGSGASVTVTPSVTTTYTLNGVNLTTNCSNTRTVSVLVNSTPVLTITPTSIIAKTKYAKN